MTQCERILNHLREHGSISAREAMLDYGIMRLASRICDLRLDGFDIKRKMVTGINRYGESTSYARYYLKEDTKNE